LQSKDWTGAVKDSVYLYRVKGDLRQLYLKAADVCMGAA